MRPATECIQHCTLHTRQDCTVNVWCLTKRLRCIVCHVDIHNIASPCRLGNRFLKSPYLSVLLIDKQQQRCLCISQTQSQYHLVVMVFATASGREGIAAGIVIVVPVALYAQSTRRQGLQATICRHMRRLSLRQFRVMRPTYRASAPILGVQTGNPIFEHSVHCC